MIRYSDIEKGMIVTRGSKWGFNGEDNELRFFNHGMVLSKNDESTRIMVRWYANSHLAGPCKDFTHVWTNDLFNTPKNSGNLLELSPEPSNYLITRKIKILDSQGHPKIIPGEEYLILHFKKNGALILQKDDEEIEWFATGNSTNKYFELLPPTKQEKSTAPERINKEPYIRNYDMPTFDEP